MRARIAMRLGLSIAVGLAAILAIPVAAHAQAATQTIHFHDSVSSREVNPCTGVPGTFSQTVKGVTHVTALPDGSVHETTTVTGSFTFVPDDPSQPTYTGKFTDRDGENLNKQNNFTATATFHFTARGSDGSKISEHAVFHITVHSDGTVAVQFERDRLSCP